MLKIDLYWDLRSTIPTRHTGVGKHVIQVLRGLAEIDQMDLRVLLARDQEGLWASQAAAYEWESLPTVTLPFTNKSLRLRAGLGLSGGLSRLLAGRDLLYSPMEMLLPVSGLPVFNTIHGIPCFEPTIPAAQYKSLRYRFERARQKLFLWRTRQLATVSMVVSEYLKSALVDRFRLPPERLHVVYNGAEDHFYLDEAQRARRTDPPHPVLLAVGGANAFDGAPHLLRVAQWLQSAIPEAELRIVGDRHEPEWEQPLRACPNVTWDGFLSSRDLLAAMRASSALLYFPAVESFGIIGVEAMACGLPVLSHHNTALPEVLGEAALYVDPTDESAVLHGIRELSGDTPTRTRLIEAGRRRAESFRWQSVVNRVAAVLERGVVLGS